MPTTNALLLRYAEKVGSPMFLSRNFRTPNKLLLSEKFKIQVRRGTRKIAVPVSSVSENGRENRVSNSSDTDWKPAIYKEQLTVTGEDLWNQEFGRLVHEQDQYAAVQARVVEIGLSEVQDKIRRGLELQCAQILATGKLDLIGEDGVSRFVVDFMPKTAHFAQAAATWAGASDKVNDLAGMIELIRKNGKRSVKDLVFGERALADFLADSNVRAILDNRRMELAEVKAPEMIAEDASYHGSFSVGQSKVRLWSYAASYDHPNTGVDTKYVNTDHIIFLPENPEFDFIFGAIPRVTPPNGTTHFGKQVILQDQGIAFDTIQWTSQDLTAHTIQAGLRAIAVPTAIDTFGRILTRF